MPARSVWRYLDDGFDQGTAWQALDYDDSFWFSGPAQLGYGDGDEATVVSYGFDPNNKYITTYFRRAFTINDPSAFTALTVRLLRDDGGVVYLNGVEVFRSNMPGEFINFFTFAASTIPNTDESAFFPSAVDPSLLVSGMNVVAVEIHQANPFSSDLSFDLELVATFAAGPPVIVTQPKSKTVAVGGTVTFQAAASGGPPLRYQWDFNGAEIPGATNATLKLLDVFAENEGKYRLTITNASGSVVSAKAQLTLVDLTGDLFQIVELSTNHAFAIEHSGVTGDDRGGIGATFNEVLVSGDSATARFNAADLSQATNLRQIHDSLVSDLRSGVMYVLVNGASPIVLGVVDGLREVDAATGALTTNTIPLSTPIDLSCCYGDVGLFSGFGRIVVRNVSRAFSIQLPSGAVQDLGPISVPLHNHSENWAYWGVAEYFNNSTWMVYVRDPQTIVRTRVADGYTIPVATFTDLADMASIIVSPVLNRWYFHHQGTSQFRSGSEVAGYADATLAFADQPQPPRIAVPPRNRVGREGRAVTLEVLALGYPLNYQWRFNDQDIPDATNSTLTLTGLSTNQSGLYSVVVNNALGTATSSSATLSVVNDRTVASFVRVYGAPSDPSWNEDVRAKIENTGLFAEVDAINFANSAAVPALEDLETFGAVLVYSDAGFNNPQAWGNVLADYVEAGGGVVVATFAFGSFPLGLEGRLKTAGYLPFTTGSQSSGIALTLVEDAPSHPILEGVSAFAGGSSSFHNTPLNLTAGTELVAHWNNGQPLVGAREVAGGRTVGLNFYPPSSDAANGSFWDANTDGGQLMANALFWAAGGVVQPTAPGIRTQPTNQTILEGLDARFNVSAYGSRPLSYQWYFGDVPILNATNRTVALTNVQTNQGGAYRVIITNAFGVITSQVATLTVPKTRGVVGYYTDGNITSTGPEQSIVRALFTPLRITDISTFDLARAKSLLLDVFDLPSLELRRRLPAIQEWVNNGGRLLVHQRYLNNQAALTANPYLLGVRGVVFTNFYSIDIDVVPPATSLVTAGPHGTLNNASLDNGEFSYSAYAIRTTLPAGSASFLSTGGSANQVVAFAYGLGSGLVYFSTIPLDYYLDYTPSSLSSIMREVYAPNILEYASAYAPSGPPVIIGGPDNTMTAVGNTAVFSVSVYGQAPSQYQWFFNNVVLLGATNNPLRLSNVTSSNAGSYRVVVSNAVGSATSSNALLTVVPRVAVGVFNHPQFVDSSGGIYDSSTNLQAALNNLGHVVDPFTSIVGAVTNDVLIFPPFIRFLGGLDSASRATLQAYVQQGGVVITHGTFYNLDFLNTVFRVSLQQAGGGSVFSRTSQALGTPFADDPVELPPNFDLSSVDINSLPFGARSIYTNFNQSALTLIPYGAGTIVHMGWTWYDAAPLGNQDGGWNEALASAVQLRGALPPPSRVLSPLVLAGSVWRYLDDGSDQGTGWRDLGFDDSSWGSGPAQFGYGDGDEATVINFGLDPNNKFITTYFRRWFTVTNPSVVTNLAVHLLRDDGAAVYLNGAEIARTYLPGEAPFDASAFGDVAGFEERTFFSFPVDSTLLRNGTNLLAVEIHQSYFASPDLSFDLELTGAVPAAAPSIRTQPRDQTVPVGSTVVLSAVAAGSLPLKYQWRFNGQDLPGATNAILLFGAITTEQSGSYSLVVSNTLGSVMSSNALLRAVTLGGDTFRIANLSTNNVQVIDHYLITGDERGGIAASAQHVYYRGNIGVGRFDLIDLADGTNLGIYYEALVSDLKTEKVYSLADGTNLITSEGGLVNSLLELDSAGQWTGASIQLSQTIELLNPPDRYGEVGIFAGVGRILLHDGRRAWSVELPSGLVVELGPVVVPTHDFTQNWAYWGLAEFFNGAFWLVYVRDAQTIVRTRVPDGFTTNVATFEHLSSMATITASLPFNRWYFHHQYSSQFGPFYQTLGFADATFVSSSPPIAPAIVRSPVSQTVAASGTAAFNVLATGTGPLRYQWRLNGVDLPGSTNAVLKLTAVTANQAGTYTVVVSNAITAVTSAPAILQVIPSVNVAVFDDPAFVYTDGTPYAHSDSVQASLRHLGHQVTTFTDIAVAAGGNGPLLFPALEANDLSFALAPSTINALHNFVARGGVLIVFGANNDPARVARFLNAVFDFTLQATYGSSGFTRTPEADGTAFADDPAMVPFNNYTQPLLSESLPPGTRRIYEAANQTAVALFPFGSGKIIFLGWNWVDAMPLGRQDGGWLTLLESATEETAPPVPQAPQILQQPRGRTIVAGTSAQFRVVATGFPLSYQWLFNGQPLAGETNAALQLSNVPGARAGTYAVAVSNALGSVSSSNVTLSVVGPLSVGVFDDRQYVSAESDNVQASLGQLGHRVQPFTDLARALTNQVLLFPVFRFADPESGFTEPNRAALQSFVQAGGVVIVHGGYANVPFIDSAFGLSLESYGYAGGLFTMTTQTAGTPFADGPASLPYNTDTFSIYSSTLPALGARDLYGIGFASVLAMISYGNGNIVYVGWDWSSGGGEGIQDGGWVETLGNAVLARTRVSPTPPVISLQPEDRTLGAGLDATFMVRGFGSVPLTPQWFYNGQAIPGATNSTLTLFSVTTNASGGYHAVLSNPFGSATSHVATLAVRATRGAVGYYADFGQYQDLETSIYEANFTPIPISDIARFDLARVDVLMISEFNDGGLSQELMDRLPAIEAWVNRGGKLIVHDRYVSQGSEQANPFLLAAPSTLLVRSLGNNIDVVPPADNLVVAGPHGTLNNSSLDGASWSMHGYALRDTLPPRAQPILRAGPNTNYAVAFSYGLGAGSVYYAAIPIDNFLNSSGARGETTRKVYVPNLLEHVAAFTATGAPLFLNEPHDTNVFAGGTTMLTVGANGQGPLAYQWLFNQAPITGATNAVLVFTGATTNQTGRYSVIVSNALGSITSAEAVLTVVQALPFQIAALTTFSSQIVEHEAVTGGDRGGIALSTTQIFYTGDSGTARFSAANLSGGTNLANYYDALVSNLRTETLYTLASGSNLVNGSDGQVTALVEINGATGDLTPNRVELSTPILLGFDTGIFAGYDAVVLSTGGRVYRIDLPSGLVHDLGPMGFFSHNTCENWAYWGVAEFFGGSVHLVYVRDFNTIARTRVPDGVTTSLATFTSLSDMCSISVSVPRGRWYFHYEGSADFGGNNQTLGSAVAFFDQGPRFTSSIANRVINEDFTTGPIAFSIRDLETSADQLRLGIILSNPGLVPATNIVFGGSSQNRTITLTPAPDQFGTSVVTLTVTDAIGQSTNRSFNLTVNPVNDPPAFTPGLNQVLAEEAPPQIVPRWATDIRPGPVNETGQTVTFLVGNDHPALFTVPPEIRADGTLTFTPSPLLRGTALVTVMLRDDGGTNMSGLDTSAVAQFTITVGMVNAPPRFSSLAMTRSNNQFRFTLAGRTGRSYTIQTSTDLLHWTSWTNFVSGNGINQFIDTTGPSSVDRRFYRAVTP